MADEDTKEGKSSEKLFKIADLPDKLQTEYKFVLERIPQLQKVRNDHYGTNLDELWAEADRSYVPHRLKSKGKKVIATDEDKGWRSSTVELGANDWQSDVSQANPFVKIQTALSILVDQNPGAVFTPASKKYQATTEITKQLYMRTWEVAKSKEQLKLFVFNMAKYGWGIARTYPLKIERKVKVLKEYNKDDPEASTYEEKTVVEYDDVMRENLDPRNTWLDDMAKPGNPRSINDWCFRKVYRMDDFKTEFAAYKKRLDLVQAGGNVQEVIDKKAKNTGKTEVGDEKNKVEVLFYENRAKDVYMVIAGANKVPIIIDPLPVSDVKGSKKLTLWQALWNLRHGESPYGVGIYEAIRYDQGMLDRIRNMTIDQLVLSIYKMFFFQGTQSLTETGDIKITPGVGKQVLDPKNISWLDVPGPGQDSFMGIQMIRKDLDEASGITDPLLGIVTGKTAFEISQAKESALKRMKNPLENITNALNDDAYLTIALMQMLYSEPEVYEIADPRLIEDYLQEVGGDPDLYERTPQEGEDGAPVMDMEGNPQTTFKAKVYREFPLNLDKDEQGNLIEAQDTRFLRAKPEALSWEGVVQIKSQSLLSPSKQVDKALELEMYNVLVPLMQQMGQERMMKQQAGMPVDIDNLTTGKTAKSIVKLYDKDPRDIFPDEWLQPPPQPLFVGMGGAAAPNPLSGAAQGGAEKLTSQPTLPQNPQSVAGQMSAALSGPARAV